ARLLVAGRAAGDEEIPGRAVDLVGLHDCQPVLPHRAIDFRLLAPRLRRQLDDVRGVPVALHGVDDLEGISGVGLLYITIERGLGAERRKGGEQRGCRNSAKEDSPEHPYYSTLVVQRGPEDRATGGRYNRSCMRRIPFLLLAFAAMLFAQKRPFDVN